MITVKKINKTNESTVGNGSSNHTEIWVTDDDYDMSPLQYNAFIE